MTKQNSHLKFPARPPSMNRIHRNSVPSVFLKFWEFLDQRGLQRWSLVVALGEV
jgi:hypothetical protein